MGTSTKPKRYFDLSEDVYIAGRWQLGSPVDERGQEVDPWQFSKGHPIQAQRRLRGPLEAKGNPLDFTLAGLDTPVVDVKVASIFAELAPNDVQMLPVDVEGQPEQFSILVATKLIQCIDEKASEEVDLLHHLWTAQEAGIRKTAPGGGELQASVHTGGRHRSRVPRCGAGPPVLTGPPAPASRSPRAHGSGPHPGRAGGGTGSAGAGAGGTPPPPSRTSRKLV